MIHDGDVVVRTFAAIGWSWGGYWSGEKDYMHFSLTASDQRLRYARVPRDWDPQYDRIADPQLLGGGTETVLDGIRDRARRRCGSGRVTEALAERLPRGRVSRRRRPATSRLPIGPFERCSRRRSSRCVDRRRGVSRDVPRLCEPAVRAHRGGLRCIAALEQSGGRPVHGQGVRQRGGDHGRLEAAGFDDIGAGSTRADPFARSRSSRCSCGRWRWARTSRR